MEMPGIEPGAFHMQSERSTAELHPRFGQNTLYATCDHMHACNWQQTYVSREQTGRFIHVWLHSIYQILRRDSCGIS